MRWIDRVPLISIGSPGFKGNPEITLFSPVDFNMSHCPMSFEGFQSKGNSLSIVFHFVNEFDQGSTVGGFKDPYLLHQYIRGEVYRELSNSIVSALWASQSRKAKRSLTTSWRLGIYIHPLTERVLFYQKILPTKPPSYIFPQLHILIRADPIALWN